MRGLRSKTNEFFSAVSACTYDVVAVTESWLQPDVLDSELFPDSYIVYRSDRRVDLVDASRGGGVLLGFSNKLAVERLNLSMICDRVPLIDFLGCKLTVNYFVFYMFIVYIPPSATDAHLEVFLEGVSSLDLMLSKNVVLLGDFNIPSYTSNLPPNAKHRLLSEFVEVLGLRQLNNVPNINNRCLDLIFTNFNIVLQSNDVPLVNEDPHHPSLLINLQAMLPHTVSFPINNNDLPQFNFRKANFPAMYELLLSTDWSPVLNCADVADSCRVFYGTLNAIFAACAPLKVKRRRHFPPWFTKEIINNVLKKEKAHRDFITHRSSHSLSRFKSLRRLVKSQSDRAYRDFVLRAESSIPADPSTFWSFIQSKRAYSRIPASMKDANQTYHGPHSIVEAFSSFFRSVYKDSQPIRDFPQ